MPDRRRQTPRSRKDISSWRLPSTPEVTSRLPTADPAPWTLTSTDEPLDSPLTGGPTVVPPTSKEHRRGNHHQGSRHRADGGRGLGRRPGLHGRARTPRARVTDRLTA